MNKEKGGMLSPELRTKCEIWSRLKIQAMGYIRSTNFFNKGKKSEFKDRKYFTEEKALNHCPYCGADYPPSKKGE